MKIYVYAGVKSLNALDCGDLSSSNTLAVPLKSLSALDCGDFSSPPPPTEVPPLARAAPLDAAARSRPTS